LRQLFTGYGALSNKMDVSRIEYLGRKVDKLSDHVLLVVAQQQERLAEVIDASPAGCERVC
jgi:hypothetical protein